MNHFKQKLQRSPGQALVEFALVITAVLMMIFLIIESGRILWAWNSVQHAAREGARYATTGSFDGTPDDCPVDFGLDKFVQAPDAGGRNVCTDLRLASIIATSHEALTGLPINEVTTTFEDDFYYNIEVWGANEFGQLQYDFAGIPNNPVIVRVTYMVPIITPFFRPIRSSIPVFGQEVLNNESFGQLGSTGGQALPPNLPPLPTAGVTPSPTPSPTGPSPTPTYTATSSPTPNPICGVQFEGLVVETQDYVQVTGEVGTVVTIQDLTDNGQQIGIGTMGGPFNGHACPGFITISVPEPELVTGHVLAAISSDGTTDTIIVISAPPTSTPSPTFTPLPTATPSPTMTPTSTATPTGPYIFLLPTCGTPNTNPGLVQFTVSFVNWPTNQSLTVLWSGNLLQLWQAGQHTGTFTQTYTRQVPQQNVTYTVTALSGGGVTNSKSFVVPCTDFPTPTPGTTPTNTPAPPDIVVFGPPEIISTPPIVAYQPVQFRVPITNSGDIDINSQFFVDIYLDPNETLVLTSTIPITESDGYSAVSRLDGGDTKIITITAQLGYSNEPEDHHVYGFADSLEQVVETDETNNITEALTGIEVTPAATPTPLPTPGGTDEISGGALTLGDDLVLQFRAFIKLIDNSTGNIVAQTTSDINGFYAFTGVAQPASTYTVTGCINIDGKVWFGSLTGIVPPNTTAHIIMFEQTGPWPCP